MLNNASKLLQRLGSTAQIPPNGTGPLGAPNRCRWVTHEDVIAWNAKQTTTTTGEEFSTMQTRAYTETPNTLYDYQLDAVRACNPCDGVFLSGIVNMECGTGKTWVASELIRRSGGVCIVVVQHSVSATQFVNHLNSTLGIRAALCTIHNGDENVDVLVTTYNRIVRIVSVLDKHRDCIRNKGCSSDYSSMDKMIMEKMCLPFCLLVLDEVHTVVADKFHHVCRLRAHAIIGFSGSLVREDDRIASLETMIGPNVYNYGNKNRRHEIYVYRAPMENEAIVNASSRTCTHQTMRALNPYKVEALLTIMDKHAQERVIIFSDSIAPTYILNETVFGNSSRILNGHVTSREARDAIVNEFATSIPGSMILLCTKVCDMSIDFPEDCIIIQFHIASGSRQQELQRCGRGNRGVRGSTMYHIVNIGSEEEQFSSHRIEHTMAEMWGTVTVQPFQTVDRIIRDLSKLPFDSMTTIKIKNDPPMKKTKHGKNALFRRCPKTFA